MASYNKRYLDKNKSDFDDDYDFDDYNYDRSDDYDDWDLPGDIGRIKSRKQAHKFHRR